MVAGHINRVVVGLRRVALDAQWSDAQLLDGFIARREPAAFELLVRRHGPMVLGVCRRILRNEADAEDAFQATFLVLVRKAATIMPREQVGNWLYGVACRTAMKARSMSDRRRTHERRAGALLRPNPVPAEFRPEVQAILDEELERLPAKYRAPVVLCDLEGKTQREAARLLGWPDGTLATRLRAARRLLAGRLTRRGLALSAGAIATVTAQTAAPAAVPAALTEITLLTTAGNVSPRVAALAEGVLKAMLITKLKTTTTLMLGMALLAITSGGLTIYAGPQDGTPPGATKPARPELPVPDPSPRAGASDSLRGVVMRVDKHEDLVQISLGHMDGVKLDQRLVIYRLKPKAMYVGQVRVVEATEHSCVARGQRLVPGAKIMVGDQVTDSLNADPARKDPDLPPGPGKGIVTDRSPSPAVDPANPRSDPRHTVDTFLAAATAGKPNEARSLLDPGLPRSDIEWIKAYTEQPPLLALVQVAGDEALAITASFEPANPPVGKKRYVIRLKRASHAQIMSGWFASDWLVADVSNLEPDAALATLVAFLARYPDSRPLVGATAQPPPRAVP
jgi:RNA polymerase sigma factor (sigma-70 family)